MNLLEFVKVMFLKLLQLCRLICASRTCCCFVVFANHSTSFVTGNQCAWWKILWRLSGKPYPHRSFAEP